MIRLLGQVVVAAGLVLFSSQAMAQSGAITGTVKDVTGGVLPGVLIDIHDATGSAVSATTDNTGSYRLEPVAAGSHEVTFSLVNFGVVKRVVAVQEGSVRLDVVMQYALNADVTVTGKRTFTNLADVENPAENLLGVALSSSQGAITARQLDARPIMRAGEVLETVPGLIISQHSGEGKATQYYLRGFNLDHGTDFATWVAGVPVNMPTNGHGHGYSDSNFLIPELVSGVQFSKGPYFADQGDFSTAGAANINYVNSLDKPLVRVGGGGQGWGRALVAASPTLKSGQLLAALELGRNDGPWDLPNDYTKVNGVIRYTKGTAVNGWSLSGLGYQASWDSTDQVPIRAIENGTIGRFGTINQTDAGDTYRYSGSFEWQTTKGNAATKVIAYGLAYDLNLYSDFTFFLDDPVNGDQFHQADHRFISGGKISHRRVGHFLGRDTQNTVGVQLRNDNIGKVGLYHTAARQHLSTTREDSVLQTSVGGYGQNETEWTSWLKTLAGIRVDGYRFDVESNDPANSGTVGAGIVSPKGGVVLGPWKGTEFYANAGLGFHSNDARGVTITRDPKTGEPVDPVTPLVRATGTEFGLRTVALPHVQSTFSLWTLSLASELLFIGDAGTTEASRPSHRYGFEFANYYAPRPWLTFDADLSVSQSHFTDDDPAGDYIPGSVETVVSAGATVDTWRQFFGSMRLRYFGPRPLVEDNSVRSKATGLVNAQAGYMFSPRVRVFVDIFNLFNAEASDIDYFYASRLPGEPADGVEDIHTHPTLPRTARVSLSVSF